MRAIPAKDTGNCKLLYDENTIPFDLNNVLLLSLSHEHDDMNCTSGLLFVLGHTNILSEILRLLRKLQQLC